MFNYLDTYLLSYSLTHWLTHSLTHSLTYLLHGAQSFLRSKPVISRSRNSPHFMEPEGSLPHSQVPANCPYPEPDRSIPCPPIPLETRDNCTPFRNKDSFYGDEVLAPCPSQAGGPPLVCCPRLLIQYISSYSPYWRPFLHPQPEHAPCRGERTHISRT